MVTYLSAVKIMKINAFIVDAFTDEIFKGNQAGVCILDEPITASVMLQIAREFGFSETAFVLQKVTDNFSIRYFSPVMEIPLCGHATMASAKVLFSEFDKLDEIIFETHFGVKLKIVKQEERIVMFFPVHNTEPCELNAQMKEAIGLSEILTCEYNSNHNILMVEIKSSDELSKLNPDYDLLKSIDTSINGILVTSKSQKPGYDFEYRYFFPWSGANEDPVTGGVQSFLCKYWSLKLEKKIMRAFQCSIRARFIKLK